MFLLSAKKKTKSKNESKERTYIHFPTLHTYIYSDKHTTIKFNKKNQLSNQYCFCPQIKCQNNSEESKMAPTPTSTDPCLEHYNDLNIDNNNLDSFLSYKDENSNTNMTAIQKFYNKKNVLITGATGELP